MVVIFADFITEDELLTLKMDAIPSEKQIVRIPSDPEGSFRFVMRVEWTIDPVDSEAVIYLSSPKGV